MSGRPNILFLMTDQHRHDGLGCVNPVVKTPNLDALAEEGIRFSQAVCNVPMCVPSRYSMMAGLYGFQIGVKHNTQMLPDDESLPVPLLPQILSDAGYQTAGIGKTHWYIGSRIMPDTPIKGSRRGFEVRALARKSEPANYEPDSLYQADDEPEWYAKLTEEQQKGGPGGESVSGYVGGTSTIPPERHREGWLARKAVDFLKNQRDASRPFFLYLSLDHPHPGFFVPEGFEGLYDIGDFPDNPPPEPMPPSHTLGTLEDRWIQMTPDQRRRSRLRYYALCSYVDNLFGKVIAALRKTGQLDNTFIIFASDHGEMLGDRGRVSKYCLYEGSVRVPMIIAGPGVDRRKAVDDRPVELVDVLPTLLTVAGVDISDTLPGFNLLSGFERGAAFAEMHGRGYEEYQQAPAVMFRTSAWKLILGLPGDLGSAFQRYDRMHGELYHLADDPLELENLYDRAEYAEVRERMTAQVLMHVMSSLGKYPFPPSRARIKVTGPATHPDKSLW